MILCFACTAAYAEPAWYGSRNIAHEPYEIMGYGEGAADNDAMGYALKDISEQIHITVSSQSELRESTYGQSSFNQLIRINSKTDFSNIQIVKTAKENDKIYMAVKYINMPLVPLVKLKQGAGACKEENTNPYIDKTLAASEFRSAIGCMPSITLFKTSDTWYAEIGLHVYALSHNDFSKFLAGVFSDDVEIAGTSAQLKPGETYRLNSTLHERGYFSLFQVNQSGSVNVLVSNLAVKNGSKITYPDIKKYNGLEAVLPENADSDKDMTLGALCSDKIDTTVFSNMSDETNISNAGFPQLIETTKGCHIASIITEVKR